MSCDTRLMTFNRLPNTRFVRSNLTFRVNDIHHTTSPEGEHSTDVGSRPDSASVLGSDLGGLDLLAQLGHEVGEPGLGDVEGLGAGDARESDRGELVVVLLVLADNAGLATKGAVDGQVAHLLDEGEVLGVGVRGARVVAGLLDHDLLGADELGELLGEPLTGVDGVEFDVAEGIALDFLTGRF